MAENDKLDIQLYLDSSDAEYWEQVIGNLKAQAWQMQYMFLNCIIQEKYLSEHNYEELLDLESARSLLNFGEDYRKFIESNNSEVQSPRFLEALRQRKCSVKIQVNYEE